MDRREFWATKSPLPVYQTVVFEHPAFDAPIRLVAEQFAPVALGGFEHRPVQMTLKPPDQTGDANGRMTIAFTRYVVGREFKQQLGLIRASGSQAPIRCTYSLYLDDLTTPAQSWVLYVAEAGGITFTPETVQVLATTDNPMRRNVARIYDPAIFTGLELI